MSSWEWGRSEEDDTAHARKRRRLDFYDDQQRPAYEYPGHDHDGAEEIPINWLVGCNEPFISGTPSQFSPQIWNPEVPNQDASKEQCIEVAEEVPSDCCYGMLSDIPVRAKKPVNTPQLRVNKLPVLFNNINGTLSPQALDDPTSLEILCPNTARILSELEATAEIATQLYCHSKSELLVAQRVEHKGRRKAKGARSWYLNIILYGPTDLDEVVGDFLTKRRMYLQDPLGCDRRVLYQNPHVMPPEMDGEVMTDSFPYSLGNLEIERLEVGPDLLEQLMEDEAPLPETDPPKIVATRLFPHQKQALTFMLRRERGWSLEVGSGDIWSREFASTGKARFRNNVNGNYHDDAPPQFRGGLLADDMGLGKTLSMICLIAANQACQTPLSPPLTPDPLEVNSCPAIKTTLLIVPPSLIQSWEKQLCLHLRGNPLKIHVFHGLNRKGVDFLGQFDVVITTFHTASAIWRRQDQLRESPESIFSVTWHRVVLDEAHTIQNAHSQLAQACCSLRSNSRWAITGTPIQNKLSDFASITKFLQVYPYSEQRTFDEDILQPWQRGDKQGFLRLKALVRAITISRTKAVVNLPSRVDEVHYLDFTLDERQVYDDVKNETVKCLQDAISSDSRNGTGFNALQRLNSLRMISSHGLLAQSYRKKKDANHTQASPLSFRTQILNSLNEEISIGCAICSQCGIEILDGSLEYSPIPNFGGPAFNAKYDDILCGLCTLMGLDVSSPFPWPSSGRLDASAVSICRSPSPALQVGADMLSMDSMPTKVNALATDLSVHCPTEKSVVFSYWTYTLDLVQAVLEDRGMLYTRVDGKMSLAKRTDSLRSFQIDESLRVILVSITCGGAGLDLTAASRAYLLEPHWNPMVEEQALCRVHRVGQKRSVTTIRYLMRDSFEEQVVEIQKRKKMLAKVTFGTELLSEAGIGLGTLRYLKSVLE